WPDFLPVTVLGEPWWVGAGSLPEHARSPRIRLPATTTGPPSAAVSSSQIPPTSWLPVITTPVVAPRIFNGPDSDVRLTWTTAAPSADTGPVSVASRTTRLAPASTVTGPVTLAPSRHSTSPVTRSG